MTDWVNVGAASMLRIAMTSLAVVFERDVGIRFNGKERFDVEEYCISEGWIKVPAGKTLDRKGKPLLITLKGRVEVYYR